MNAAQRHQLQFDTLEWCACARTLSAPETPSWLRDHCVERKRELEEIHPHLKTKEN